MGRSKKFKIHLTEEESKKLQQTINRKTTGKGGSLFLGVEDNGKITGVQGQHADEIGVAALVANRTIPSVAIKAEIISEENRNVLQISDLLNISDSQVYRILKSWRIEKSSF